MKRVLEVLAALAVLAGVGYWLFGDRLLPDAAVETAGNEVAAEAPRGPGGRGGGGGRVATVTLETVEERPFALVYEVVGSIEAEARVTTVSEASGQIEEVFISAGDSIAAGAPMVRLEQQAQVLDLAAAQAELVEAKASMERVERLRTSGSAAVSAVQLQEAQTALELAQVAVDRADYELDRRTIRAPISGVVGLTQVKTGDYIGTGTEIATVSIPDELNVRFSLPENAVPVLKRGLEVDVSLPTRVGQVFKATITAIDTEIDPVTRLIEVEARLTGDVSGLRHGMIANVVLSQEQAPLPAIPAISLSWSRDGASVFVSEGGSVRRVPVTVQHRLDDTVWVSADLAAGEEIVVEGVQKVREGGQVQTLEMAQAGGGARRPGAAGGEGRQAND